MRILQLSLLALVLTLAPHEAKASIFKEDADGTAEIVEKILVGKEDRQDLKPLKSAFEISDEDGNMQLRFWFHSDDDEDGESDVDSDEDNNGAIIPEDGDGDDDDDDDDAHESYEGEPSQFGLENRRKFDRRRRYQHQEEREFGEQNKVYRCIRYGCFGRYGHAAYDDDEEYANNPWENYYRRHGHGRGGYYGWGRDLFSSGDEEEIDEI